VNPPRPDRIVSPASSLFRQLWSAQGDPLLWSWAFTSSTVLAFLQILKLTKGVVLSYTSGMGGSHGFENKTAVFKSLVYDELTVCHLRRLTVIEPLLPHPHTKIPQDLLNSPYVWFVDSSARLTLARSSKSSYRLIWLSTQISPL